MDLFEKFLSQLAAVQSVWLPFVLAVAIVAVIIWRGVDYAYKTRLTNADSTKDLLGRRLQEYQDKLSGATPDEARSRIDALEARMDGLIPRRISAEQRESMAKILDGFKGEIALIVQDMASAEASSLARSLTAGFHSAGWIVHAGMVMGIGNPPLTGIRLEVSDRQAPTEQESAAMEALRAAGLEYDVQVAPMPSSYGGEPTPSVRIMVTNRQQD